MSDHDDAHQLTGTERIPRVPYAPLARQLDLLGGPGPAMTAAGLVRGTRRWKHLDKAIERGVRTGQITMHAADRIACLVLRLHPCLVWGDTWWTADEQPAAGQPAQNGAAA